MEVGIRDLRNNLSRHLDQVRAGETITVTDRGRPIASIEPVGRPSRFDKLVAEGRITRAQLPKGGIEDLPEPIVIPGLTHESLMEEVEEGRGRT